MRTNVITIEKGIPMPSYNKGKSQSYKYVFMNRMQVGDSFSINEDNPDYTPKSVRCYVYSKQIKNNRKYSVRTTKGHSDNPTSIRVWRTQ
jgi:hypothetical protein